MAYTDKKLEAKRLYIEDGKAVKEIIELLGINEKTLYRWIQDGKWEKEKEEIALTSINAYKQALKIAVDKLTKMAATGEINPAEADAIMKIVRSVKSLQKDVDNLGSILLMVAELTNYLSETSPEALQSLIPCLDGFRQAMSKKFGKKS